MDGGGLSIALLGPLEVRLGGVPVRLTTGRLRALLAVLAVFAGDVVTVERLAAALWGERLPVHARRSVQTYVTRLRRVIGRAAIRTTPDGYLLDVAPGRVDVLRFQALVAEAGRVRGTAAERGLLEEAGRLWRGTPFGGIESDWLRATVSPSLQELQLSAVERRADLGLAEGRHGELVAELLALAAGHPLRESLWERLLVVLERSGRQAEALAMYERLRRRLAEELGVDPSAELRRIHTSLLRPKPVVSAPDVTVFTGVLEPYARVCVISGRAGEGRRFLALVWNSTQGQGPRAGR
ncbi:AfsR/SARP family transcriptional regulator [Nonomuraea gerenzanensis]|uniref:Transcriptional regulator, SARP family n=1 Tax=Nonomuraea gerenzanensis TaxID=93944 RepID=A0A1M4E990_9ACTN|nr:BTAD domain-containing putative transcriptional regulator [Nonomuraea gerenzanensis]UBU17637.1 winged helix-turn-helix domain-containing protein [Nonomuraea gerenzanensis]SBO95405.1 transcriptional regulator, SARP family [Nonomuraea gerenzanensis]